MFWLGLICGAIMVAGVFFVVILKAFGEDKKYYKRK
jgi:hypothetical protein